MSVFQRQENQENLEKRCPSETKGPATNSAEFRTLTWGTLMADERTHYHLARQISRHPKGIHLWRKFIEMLVIL